jgi:hypothetical protein
LPRIVSCKPMSLKPDPDLLRGHSAGRSRHGRTPRQPIFTHPIANIDNLIVVETRAC